LKAYSTNSDFGQVSQFENNLSQLAEAHESTRQKAEKAKSKGKTSKKQEDKKMRDENDARASWETESPLILEKMQTIDEARLILLKDLFVKCMMMEVEMATGSISEAEGIINSLLSLVPTKEVEAFATQQKNAPPTIERRRSTIGSTQTFVPSPSSSRASPIQARATPSISEDSGSVKEKRKSRFGTILRSGRNSIKPGNLHLRAISPNKKQKDADRDHPEHERAQTFATLTSQNGVNDHSEPIAPMRSSSMPVPEPPIRSPVRDERPTSRDQEDIYGTPIAENESILSNDSNYAPPLRVEIMKDIIPEEAGEREAAVNTLQSTLRSQPTVSRKTRGRRDGRGSVIATDTNEFGIISAPITELAQMSISPTYSTSPTTSMQRNLSPIRQDSDTQSLSSVRTASRPTGIALHPDLEIPGFNISVLESLSAILSDNKVQKIFVTGEVALSMHGQRASGINISNPEKFEQIVVNKSLLDDAGNGTYALTAETLPPKGAIALKYKATLPGDPQTLVPLLVRAMWKVEQGTVSLMVGYQANPAFTQSGTLTNVAISATLPTEPRITGCQSKPQGQFARDRGQLIWQIPQIGDTEQMLLARFTVDGLTKVGTVEAKWECKDVTVSGIDVDGIAAKDPFADDEDVFFQANILRNLVSGKYYCQS